MSKHVRTAEGKAVTSYRLNQAIAKRARQMIALMRARLDADGADPDLAERIIISPCCVSVDDGEGDDAGVWDVVEWRHY